MPETPKKRTETIHVRLTEEGVAKLDELRRTESRSAYIRRLLKVGIAQEIRGPKEADL
jgi:Arc/MetJ-type ribon-helix-helix transcriptional regulator